MACGCANPAVLQHSPPFLALHKDTSLLRGSPGSLHHAPLHSWKDASHLSHVTITSYIVPPGLSEVEKKASLFCLARNLRTLLTRPLGVSTTLAAYESVWISERVSPAYISEGLGSSTQIFAPCISNGYRLQGSQMSTYKCMCHLGLTDFLY